MSLLRGQSKRILVKNAHELGLQAFLTAEARCLERWSREKQAGCLSVVQAPTGLGATEAKANEHVID